MVEEEEDKKGGTKNSAFFVALRAREGGGPRDRTEGGVKRRHVCFKCFVVTKQKRRKDEDFLIPRRKVRCERY